MNTTEQKFDLEYFIDKFEAIPEDQWTTGEYINDDGCKCAYGHCGLRGSVSDTKESYALFNLDCNAKDSITCVNDNYNNSYIHLGSTPKQRVVNYLKSLR